MLTNVLNEGLMRVGVGVGDRVRVRGLGLHYLCV